MDIFEIFDKLMDYTGWPEEKQDHLKAGLKGAILEVYHGAHVAGQVEKAEEVANFGIKYAGLVKDDFSRYM